MIEFIAGAIQGVAGNLLTRVLDAFWGRATANTPPEASSPLIPDEPNNEDIPRAPRRFQTFHIKSGFESVLSATPDAVVHVVIEDKPTTAWHLAILVVESRSTGEWYVSGKGEMAFEGGGGGVAVSKRVASICSNRRITVAGWVCPRAISDKLSRGEVLWPTVKTELVPLISYAESDYFAKYIASRFREINA